MKINVKDLVGSVHALEEFGARIGWPDDSTVVEIAEPDRFIASLDTAVRVFHNLRPDTPPLIDIDMNAIRRSIDVRVVQDGRCHDHSNVEASVAPAFEFLRQVVEDNKGTFHYWGGNNYFDVSLPYRGSMREEISNVKHLPWNERYTHILNRASWTSLRHTVFRFSQLASSFAARCLEFRLKDVLIPSVGLCIHPWLLAHHGLSVVATDIACSALAALSKPEQWPRLFSRAAYERWDISQSATYASQGNPERCAEMPHLEDLGIREPLQRLINFAFADWADLPLDSRSVEAIFATNALPRESAAERAGVLREWARVIRPGGIVFIAQHNFFELDVEPLLRDSNWVEAKVLNGERPGHPGATGYQLYYSSG